MKKFLVLAITLATLAWATPAKAAEPILFNPDGVAGGEPTETITGLDWAVGNSLLVESVPPVPTIICIADCDPNVIIEGTDGAGTVYFQANLANAYFTAGVGLFNNGDSGIYYTVVAAYGVTIEQTILEGDATSTFELDLTNTTNFFNIYQSTTAPTGYLGLDNNLTGVCFTCGTLVLSGTAIGAGFQADFTVNDIAQQIIDGGVNLDQSGDGDQYPLVNTLSGGGNTQITVSVIYRDINYFPDLNIGQTFVVTNTQTINPYTTVNPSACFDSNGIFDAGQLDGDCADFSEILGANNVGTINGTTSRIVTQTDANSSFESPITFQNPIPEPTTLSLLGLGLLLGGAHLRRRAKKKA